MSKMDALRALREARYEQDRAAASSKPAKPARAAKVAVARESEPVTTDAAVDDALCGHRNMSGRTCTRERGHAAKSHRYS